MKQKQLHSTDGGATFMQSTKFAYNERGWLKNSASPQFSLKLGYDTLSNPQYNGNISTQLWGSGYGNRFNYVYDGLNRLTSAASTGVVMSETIGYDVMGNISSLNRDGASGSYNYTGNRLNSISGGLATGSYAYDANGNATTDGRTGVTLGYNLLNLPATATKPGLNLAYTYDANGSKLRKVSTTTGTTTTDYVGGIQYTDGAIDFIQTEEGRALNSSGSYSYQYNLTDHLGNVRYSFDIYGGAVRPLQEDDYYAFGLKRNVRAGTNNYLYNGKELQDELGQYDYGARFYDPIIGRFNVVDGLAEEMRSYSPYNYGLNNPLRFTDPDGNAPVDIILRGKNNSSVTLKTDLIDIEVNASSLGIDFGGNYTLEGEAVLSAGLDIVGILDPTGIADGLNAGLQAKNGDWLGAGISALGIIPYVGDLAKAGKIGKDVKIINNAIDEVKSAKQLLKEGRAGKQEKLTELMTDPKLGKADKGWLKQEKNAVDAGKRTNMRNPPGKDLAHERGREAAKGYSYKHSKLQNKADHKTQHKYDNNGKKNKERPIEQ